MKQITSTFILFYVTAYQTHYHSPHPQKVLLIQVFFFSNSKDKQSLGLPTAILRTIAHH